MAHPTEIFFTSDLHIGHEKVAALRGYSDTRAHDLGLVDRWDSVVRDTDRVYVLGDVTGDARSLDHAIDVLNALPGEKHLIAGNHDACHPMNRNAFRALPRYLDAFASVQSSARFKGYGIDVLLSHFPYVRDRAETRYPQWRLPNLGEWLLHGHTHGTEKATVDVSVVHADNSPLSPVIAREFHSREIHVGLDAWDLAPVHLDHLADLIKEHTP